MTMLGLCGHDLVSYVDVISYQYRLSHVRAWARTERLGNVWGTLLAYRYERPGISSTVE